MAHAKKEHLQNLSILIAEIRKISALKEKSFGCFYHKGKGILHFHIKVDRLYAHVFNGKNWVEVDLVIPMQEKSQRQIAKKIAGFLPLEASPSK